MDPCCGYPAKRATRLIAYIDMILSIFSGLIMLFLIMVVISNGGNIQNEIDNDKDAFPETATLFSLSETSLILTLVLYMFYAAMMFILAQFLLYAASEKNPSKLNTWWIITIVLTSFRLIFYISGIMFGLFFVTWGWIGLIYSFYSLWVVSFYIKEIGLENLYASGAGGFYTTALPTETTYLRDTNSSVLGFQDFMKYDNRTANLTEREQPL